MKICAQIGAALPLIIEQVAGNNYCLILGEHVLCSPRIRQSTGKEYTAHQRNRIAHTGNTRAANIASAPHPIRAYASARTARYGFVPDSADVADSAFSRADDLPAPATVQPVAVSPCPSPDTRRADSTGPTQQR